MLWTTAAYAMGGAGQAGQDPTGGLMGFMPIILMFAVFYFLLIRPQQKRAKEQRTLNAALKRGDEIITAGGLYGRVVETHDEYLVVDLGETKIKVARASVSPVPQPVKKTEKDDKKNKDSKIVE